MGCEKEIQFNPSVNCWTEKNIGMEPNKNWDLRLTRVSDATPITARAALAPKLADAEKHIELFYNLRKKEQDTVLMECNYYRIKSILVLLGFCALFKSFTKWMEIENFAICIFLLL